MKIRLGYVANPMTFDDINYNHIVTYTLFEKLGIEQQKEKLDFLIHWNLEEFLTVLKYNLSHDILFYRMSHNLVPLATHSKVDFDYITPYQQTWREIGEFIKNNNMRVDTHPDQFCVLNSKNPEVVKSTETMLLFHEKLFQAMGIKGQCILHVGGGVDDKESGKKRFIKNFKKLPKTIQKLIILENDDVIYTTSDVLDICETLKIPMVFDYHHYKVLHDKTKIDTLLPRILKTWEESDYTPKMHFSSPKARNEMRSHSEYLDYKEFIKFLNFLKVENQDVDVMLECKKKDEALFRLGRQLKFKTDYEFLNETTFIVK